MCGSTRQEIDALAARLGMTVAEFERKYVREVGVRRTLKERKNYDCVFLDAETRKCTVYEDRPRQCRTWPFWDSNLEVPRGLAAHLRGLPRQRQGEALLARDDRRAGGGHPASRRPPDALHAACASPAR